MAYCGPRGLPLSEFLDWEQADQDAALGWQARENQRYPDGTHPDDWDESRGGSRRPYHVHMSVHPAAALIANAQASDRFRALGPGAHVHLARGSGADCQTCLREIELRREEHARGEQH
jgi:hypothetical protein